MNDPAIPPPDGGRHVGHEMTDASPLALGLFALLLSLMVAIVLLFLIWLFWQFEGEAKRADPPQSPLAVDEPPPPPRLEVDPGADLGRLRRAEEKTLSTYGWIDRQQGVARVPIDQAIKLLAERGLPEPKAKSAEPEKKAPEKKKPEKKEPEKKAPPKKEAAP
jgi:hypothetical protein